MGEHLWFGDQEGRTSEEAAFLTELRHQASAWAVPGLDPRNHTSSQIDLTPLYLDLEVPGLDDAPLKMLEVAYWGTTSARSQLEGMWGYSSYVLDGPRLPGDLDVRVTGVAVPAEQMARWAAEWMLRQLQRPIVREDWLDGTQVVASIWRWTDDGHAFTATGSRRHRRHRRRPADRRTLIRNSEAPS